MSMSISIAISASLAAVSNRRWTPINDDGTAAQQASPVNKRGAAGGVGSHNTCALSTALCCKSFLAIQVSNKEMGPWW
ncbi:hypothetical protein ACLOJK_008400 [Asimina triloba]